MRTYILGGFFAGLLLLIAPLLLGPGGERIALITPAAAQADCTAATLARLEGRQIAAISRSDQQAYERWCMQAASRDTQATRSGTSSLAAVGDPQGIWCPPFSQNCFCWQGAAYNGCMNFQAHCTSGLSCGPGGHACKCTANR